jgi:CheY-like chemotaxis protein
MPHKLLLADDSVTIQRVIELTFADEDIQVIAVGDGRQAIERVQSERPDIVLADVGMPERDGYEVAAFVKGTPEFAHIPVLLLTGAFEPIDDGRARAAGCDGVLVKPFEPQLVISRVKELISSRRTGVEHGRTAAAHQAHDRNAIAAPAAAPPAGAPAEPPQPGSIEEYFDRLDAAFSTLEPSGTVTPRGGEPAPQPAGEPPRPSYTKLAEELAGWDPDDLRARPVRPVTGTPADSPVTVPASPPPAAGGISLAEAFASLLAAEQGQAFVPPLSSLRASDEDLVEQITERVIARMTDRAVKDTVLDVAERLVREEIARIKAAAR